MYIPYELNPIPLYAVIISGPHYPGNSWVLAGTNSQGFTENCVPEDPGPTPGLSREIFPSKEPEIYYPWMSAYAGTLTKGAQGYGVRTYLGIYKKNVTRSLRQVTTIPG